MMKEMLALSLSHHRAILKLFETNATTILFVFTLNASEVSNWYFLFKHANSKF